MTDQKEEEDFDTISVYSFTKQYKNSYRDIDEKTSIISI